MLRRIHAVRSITSHVTCAQQRRAFQPSATLLSSRAPPPRGHTDSTALFPRTTSDEPAEHSSNATTQTQSERSITQASESGSESGTSCTTIPPLSSLLPSTVSTPQSHHDLASFLAYARRTSLDPASTVYLGTRYEYIVQRTLQRYGFELVRVGGRGDFGVDLMGYWYLPGSSGGVEKQMPLRVVVQCKRLTGKGKMGPNLVRELEGAFRGAPVGWRGDGVVGLLVGIKAATKGVVQALRRSERAVGWVLLEEREDEWDREDGNSSRPSDAEQCGPDSGRGKVMQILWNQKAREAGLEGVDVVKKYDEYGDDEVVLMHRGRIITSQVEQVEDGRIHSM